MGKKKTQAGFSLVNVVVGGSGIKKQLCRMKSHRENPEELEKESFQCLLYY